MVIIVINSLVICVCDLTFFNFYFTVLYSMLPEQGHDVLSGDAYCVIVVEFFV